MAGDSLEQQLIEAAQQIDVAQAKALIEKGAGVNAMDPDMGQTPLMFAASGGSLEMVDALLNAGADPNIAGSDPGFEGWTALMYAAEGLTKEALDIVDRLLTAGAELNAQTEDGRTALMLAADRGDLAADCLQRLLKLGADPALPNAQGDTALAIALMREATAAIAALEAAGAPVDVVPEATLSKAARVGELGEVLRLIASGVELNAVVRNATAVGSAAARGHLEVVKALIEAGADVNKVEPIGEWSPLMRAAYNGHASIVKALLDAGAALDLKEEDGEDVRSLLELGIADELVTADRAKQITALLNAAQDAES